MATDLGNQDPSPDIPVLSALDPVIDTPRLRLRPFTLDDVEAIWPYVSDPAFPRMMIWDAHADRDATRKWLASTIDDWTKGTGATWAMTIDGTACGSIGLHGVCYQVAALRVDRAELGYWLAPPHWNRGLTTEAAVAVMAFDQAERDRPAVDDHERAGGARAGLVDRLGDEPLAGAGLRLDEDGGVALGQPGNQREDATHRRAHADESAELGRLAQRLRPVVVGGLEAKRRLAGADERVGLEVDRLGAEPGDPGAVAAAEIAQEVALGRGGDGKVMPRHGAVAEGDVVARRGADGELHVLARHVPSPSRARAEKTRGRCHRSAGGEYSPYAPHTFARRATDAARAQGHR